MALPPPSAGACPTACGTAPGHGRSRCGPGWPRRAPCSLRASLRCSPSWRAADVAPWRSASTRALRRSCSPGRSARRGAAPRRAARRRHGVLAAGRRARREGSGARATRRRGGPQGRWHVQTSEGTASGWSAPVDLVFIDGDHSQAACHLDWELWSPHVATGGVVISTTPTAGDPGPTAVVEDLFGEGGAGRRGWRVSAAGTPWSP
jgi:hypothetical protein